MSTSTCTDRADSQLSSGPCKTGRGVFVRGTDDSVLADFGGVVREGDGRRLPSSERRSVLAVRYRWSSSNRSGARDSRGGLVSSGSAGGGDCATWVHRSFLCLHSAQPGTFGRPRHRACALAPRHLHINAHEIRRKWVITVSNSSEKCTESDPISGVPRPSHCRAPSIFPMSPSKKNP